MSRCFFCKFNTNPSIHEIENLDKFISPRKKILHREKTNVCAKHQRVLTKVIKHARFLALIPFVSYQGIK